MSAELGEADTQEILRTGVPAADAERAAAGWGGGRYELWRRGAPPAGGCMAPCVSRDALVLGWAWDRGDEATEFATAVPRALQDCLGAVPAGSAPGRWTARSGGVAFLLEGRRAGLAFAPDVAAAARLVARAAGG